MLSILYIDDEPGLLEVGKLFLESTGDFSVTTVLSGQEGLEQLAQQTFDAIVSDYQMPEMDGIEVLKAVRKTYGTIPFILFTGRGREEVVVEAINNGVDFYLQKGGDAKAQFAELAHKIRQAVTRRQAEAALSESEKRLADLINFLPDATFAIDINRKVIAWNRAIEEMTGIPAASILGKGDYEYAIPFYGERRPILIDMILEPDENVSEYYRNIVRDGGAISAETDLPHPKGLPIYVLAKASPLYNRTGKIIGAIEAIRDITDRKKNEEELIAANEQLAASSQELRAQYEELVQGEQRIRETEVRLRFIAGFYDYARTSERDLLEYAIEGAGTITGSPLAYLAFLSDDESELSMYAWSRSAMNECAIQEKPILYKTEKTGLWGEAVRQRKAVITNDYEAPSSLKRGYPEGHPRILRHMNIPVIENGHIVLVAGVANKPTDYTENDTVELSLLMQALWLLVKQKRIEQTRAESEARYRMLVDHSPAGMHFWEMKPDDTLVLTGTNPSADALLGFGLMDVVGKAIDEMFPDIIQDGGLDELRRVATEGGIWQAERGFQVEGEGWKTFSLTAFRISLDTIVTMFIDITGRKKAEEDLRSAYEQVTTTEEKLRKQFNELSDAQEEILLRQQQLEEITTTVPGVVYQYSVLPDGTRDFSFVNTDSARRIFGMDGTADRFLQYMVTHIHPDDRERFKQSIDEVVAGESDWSFEGRFIKPSGEMIWFQGMSRPARHGDTLVYSGVFLDITARKTIETSLQESEELYRLVTENTPEMIYFLDTAGYARYVNDVTARALNSDPTTLTGKDLSEALPPETAERIMQVIRNVIATRTPFKGESLLTLPAGTVWLDVRIVPLIDESGTVLGVLGLSYDITDRKAAEHALRESAAKYRTLVENSHDIIYTIRLDGTLTYVSPSWTTFLGHEIKDVEGQKFQQFVHPADIPACEEFLARAGTTRERSSELEYRVFHADGSIRIHTSNLTPVFDDRGTLVSVVGDARDITDLKQTQNAIRESNRKLNLLSSITRHDVANQLTVVQGYTQLAALRTQDPVINDFLAKIAASLDVIQHQIEFTRTYQDLGLQEPAWVPVAEVIQMVRPDEIFLDCTCTDWIFADPMIDKVFFNLFDNAVRYGKTVTTVTVRSEQVEDDLVITFEDNGIGIPLNEKPKIFEKGFGQHTGFGLFLVREILAITGISIHETGTHGKGARFEITVPKGAFRSA